METHYESSQINIANHFNVLERTLGGLWART